MNDRDDLIALMRYYNECVLKGRQSCLIKTSKHIGMRTTG